MRAILPPVVLLALVGAAAPLPAGPDAPPRWRWQQELAVDQPGPVAVDLPVETLDAARADLADLRLFDPAGREQAFALLRPQPPADRVVSPESTSGSVEDAATVFVLKTGVNGEITALDIDAGGQRFLTRARVEAADDGLDWRVLGRNLPVYDRGAQVRSLRLDIPPGVYPYLRLTLDRLGGEHTALRGIELVARSAEAGAPEPVAAAIAARAELPGETRLALALPGAHLWLAGIELTTPEPVFDRPARLVYQAFTGERVEEVALWAGRIARGGPAGDRPVFLTVEQNAPQRALTLIIDNGDSPPLALTGIAARRRPVAAVFYAASAGRYALAAGFPQAGAPRYDVGALTADSSASRAVRLTPGPLLPNPAYQPGEALPEIAAVGTPLAVEPWADRRPVRISASGVQQLELTPGVLARAQADLGDLRLVSDGRQVPYVVERTSLTRALAVDAVPAPDPKQPRLSRWRLALPEPRLPLRRLTAAVPTPLFRRDLRLGEDIEDERGQVTRRWLGQAVWNQTPDHRAAAFVIALNERPEGRTLWLETDNGDNPPIDLAGVRVHCAVTRLLFKAAPDRPLFLYYGNPAAAAPRYDLGMVGEQLLAAEKTGAELGDEQALKGSSWGETIALAGRSGILFWGILGLVVILLLAVIARLLPKAPPTSGPSA